MSLSDTELQPALQQVLAFFPPEILGEVDLLVPERVILQMKNGRMGDERIQYAKLYAYKIEQVIEAFGLPHQASDVIGLSGFLYIGRDVIAALAEAAQRDPQKFAQVFAQKPPVAPRVEYKPFQVDGAQQIRDLRLDTESGDRLVKLLDTLQISPELTAVTRRKAFMPGSEADVSFEFPTGSQTAAKGLLQGLQALKNMVMADGRHTVPGGPSSVFLLGPDKPLFVNIDIESLQALLDFCATSPVVSSVALARAGDISAQQGR